MGTTDQLTSKMIDMSMAYDHSVCADGLLKNRGAVSTFIIFQIINASLDINKNEAQRKEYDYTPIHRLHDI
jgi:hypothetical protein